jgi:hypothetical protein
LDRTPIRSPNQNGQLPGFVAAGFLAGTGFCLLRLLLGLWAVHHCRRRSQLVEDPALHTLAETLQSEMNCRRKVEIRESTELTTAATVGWRHPVLFLPKDWHTWSDTERCAVLAHELAHIGRCDYVTGLVARVSVALHFYHPLVYWMAGRLHLQQELAADAWGAQFAGGRGPYLRALAQLALRHEGPLPAWPVRTFLPARGTLLRRIQMLRAKGQAVSQPVSWTRRVGTIVLLLIVSLGVSVLRGPAQSVGIDAPPDRGPSRPQAPAETFQRFYAGGFHSVRGFEFRGVGSEPDGLEAGSDFLFLNSLEYQVPVEANHQLYPVCFVDSGTVERSVAVKDYRVSAGCGVRFVVPMLGPVPISLSFGFPIVKDSPDREQIFSFWIGYFR